MDTYLCFMVGSIKVTVFIAILIWCRKRVVESFVNCVSALVDEVYRFGIYCRAAFVRLQLIWRLFWFIFCIRFISVFSSWLSVLFFVFSFFMHLLDSANRQRPSVVHVLVYHVVIMLLLFYVERLMFNVFGAVIRDCCKFYSSCVKCNII